MKELKIPFTFYDFFGYFLPGLITVLAIILLYVPSHDVKILKAMVEAVRTTEKALGTASYATSEHESEMHRFRRSLFVVQDMKAGEMFTLENVRSIRPGYGLHTRHLEEVIGRYASRDINRGTPLTWNLMGGARA